MVIARHFSTVRYRNIPLTISLELCLLLGCFTGYAKNIDTVRSSWPSYKERVLRSQDLIPGWCNREKAERMMDLIYEVRPALCVEVGVFGGSSIYPTASALKFLKAGVVCAIDPWRNDDCLVGYPAGDANHEWWSRIDLENIYQQFVRMLGSFQLMPYCNIMRMTSCQAVSQFEDESIDILHIDGNLSEASALYDVQCYLPKVKMGGYIWLDDINWSSTTSACEFLCDYCEWEEAYSAFSYALFKRIE